MINKKDEDREKLLRQQQLLEAYTSPSVETYAQQINNINLETSTSITAEQSTSKMNNNYDENFTPKVLTETIPKKVTDGKRKSSNEEIEEFRDKTMSQNSSDYHYYDYDSSEMTDEDYL